MYNIGPIFPIILLVFLLLFFCLIADKINTFKNYTALALMQLCLLLCLRHWSPSISRPQHYLMGYTSGVLAHQY